MFSTVFCRIYYFFITFLLHLLVTTIYLFNIIFYIAYIFNSGGIILNNVDISKLLSALSKMDKKELEEGITKANEILKSKDKNSDIVNKLKNM